jgi:hypothetical protein
MASSQATVGTGALCTLDRPPFASESPLQPARSTAPVPAAATRGSRTRRLTIVMSVTRRTALPFRATTGRDGRARRPFGSLGTRAEEVETYARTASVRQAMRGPRPVSRSARTATSLGACAAGAKRSASSVTGPHVALCRKNDTLAASTGMVSPICSCHPAPAGRRHGRAPSNSGPR